MLSVALLGLVLICNFLRRHFCHLHAYLPACFYEKRSLLSLRRFRTVETIPICKSRDDGADMRFRNS